VIRPPALKPGARIALVAPAGPLGDGAVDRAIDRVHAWGFEAVPGEHVRKRHGYLSAMDQERAQDLNAALADDSVDAVWALRGGYGVMRILPSVDWESLARHPRAVIGFSDNTALHLGIQRLGMTSFHGPHPATNELNDFSRDSLLSALTLTDAPGILPFPADAPGAEAIAGGTAEGRLVGGNLSLIAATLGTPYAINADGAILFLEEVGEAPYRVDRLLQQLRLAGVLNGVAGIALGAFTEGGDDADSPGVRDVLADVLGGLGVPVAHGFPFGHVDDNWTLPVGVRARLDADAGTVELLEPAVG
jgi:muramoyltetrapeptide carboxypeptidase